MMSLQDIIDYYANLLILQYRGKPKAYATIQTVVKPFLMDNLPLTVQDAFSVASAVGVQLDVVGKYAGVTRSGTGFTGPITLGDDEFRELIKLAIIRNNSGSSLAAIQALLAIYFLGVILVFDKKNMQMDFIINADYISSNLAQLFLTEGLLPKPMGVQLSSIIYAPAITTFFGFRTYDLPGFNVTPFNSYAAYQMHWHWLTYADKLG